MVIEIYSLQHEETIDTGGATEAGRTAKMLKLLRPLWLGKCDMCTRRTRVRGRYMYEAQKSLQVCVTCVPVDSDDMAHESSKLVLAGY